MSKLAPTCSSKDADPRARTKVQPRWILLVSTLVLGLAPCQTLSAETGVAASPDTAAPHKPQPLFEFRELYALGHFGNSYEVMGNDEFRSVFAENKFWGFNSYADWFNTDDCKDPFASGHTYGLGDAQWDAKKEHLAIVQRLGLLRTLELHPNHVYITQCLPGLLATRAAPNSSQVVHGQLICPSIPAARAMILKNHENMFADLARSGVRLDRLMACPYDFGGCRCKKCDPWILTFAKLTQEIYQIARKYHPHVKMNMMGWWWKPEEHRLFAEWADKNAPGWVDIMQLQVLYGETRTSDLPLPKGCRRGAFIHIGYAEQKAPLDIYDHFGPVIAADRIERTVANLKAQGTVGFSAYSEGNYADVNCALLAGLSAGEYQTADEVLAAYARRYFGVDADTARLWAAWLKPWGKPFQVDVRQSAATLETLRKKTPKGGWRLHAWELKQQLFAANKEIGAGNTWTPARLAAVERFWSVQEQIQRGLFGLAPQRHSFGRRYTPTPWYPSWAKFKAQQALQVKDW